MDVLVFGDQTADHLPALKKICQIRSNGSLSTFLDLSSVAIRDEVERLPSASRREIPDFLTVADLVDAYYQLGIKIASLESCLVTLTQLAHYIG